MKKFTVDRHMNGEHVVKACTEAFPTLTKASLYKALKHKDIRIDGKKTSTDIKVLEGQEIQIWLPDSEFDKKPDEQNKTQNRPPFTIVAQTDGMLIVNKRQGLPVHSGKTTGENLIDIVREQTNNKNAELVHRIDMNTGGILMIAKDKEYLEDAVKLFKEEKVTKRYRALVVGKIPADLGEAVVCQDDALMSEVKAYLEKTKGGEVYIHDIKQEGDLPISTRYRVLGYHGGFTEIECELVTGRTHQIRAQFAHLGYPVLGDGNYGRNQVNLSFESKDGKKIRHQQLWSTTLLFGRIPQDNRHHELSGRKFSIEPRYEVKI